jgi:hypothetical protein
VKRSTSSLTPEEKFAIRESTKSAVRRFVKNASPSVWVTQDPREIEAAEELCKEGVLKPAPKDDPHRMTRSFVWWTQ